jgi:hypothetical protein
MKQFKLVLVLLVGLVFTSCSPEGEASIEKSLVVERVEQTVASSNCSDCLQSVYSYRVKLKANSGSVFYYTDYKHEIGDTLISIFEFTDSRDGIIKTTESQRDSLIEMNTKFKKKNDELELYNSILMGIIQENALKTN